MNFSSKRNKNDYLNLGDDALMSQYKDMTSALRNIRYQNKSFKLHPTRESFDVGDAMHMSNSRENLNDFK